MPGITGNPEHSGKKHPWRMAETSETSLSNGARKWWDLVLGSWVILSALDLHADSSTDIYPKMTFTNILFPFFTVLRSNLHSKWLSILVILFLLSLEGEDFYFYLTFALDFGISWAVRTYAYTFNLYLSRRLLQELLGRKKNPLSQLWYLPLFDGVKASTHTEASEVGGVGNV